MSRDFGDLIIVHKAIAVCKSVSCRFEKMAVMLLHEKRKGTHSAVSGYVEQLPADFDTLLHWSDQEMQLLMYPHLLQQVCWA